jgi:hypothetical protein
MEAESSSGTSVDFQQTTRLYVPVDKILPRMGCKRNAYRILVGKPEGKKPLEGPMRRWEDNIKMDLREMGWGSTDCINLAQDRDHCRTLVNAIMNLRVPSNIGKL